MSLSPRDLQLVKNFLIGGAAIGGTTALGTSLVNYLKYLKSQGKDTSSDDDTLYINLRKPDPVKEASLGGPLALTGGALTLLGANALVRSLYQKFKREQLQKKLDEAQQGYADILEDEAEKNKQASFSGGKSIGVGETLTSIPLTMAILLSLASGVVANKTLQKSFPGASKPISRDPKRVVIRTEQPVADSPVDDEEDKEVKLAHFKDAQEFMIRGVMAAGPGDTATAVAALSQGRLSTMVEALEYGVDTMMDTIKGAELTKSSSTDTGLGVALAVQSSSMAEVLPLIAAAEYVDRYPALSKIAAALPADVQAALQGMAGNMGAASRASDAAGLSEVLNGIPVQDTASGPLSLEDIISMVLEQNRGNKPTDDDDSASTDSDDNHADTSKNKDVIDEILT